MRRSRMTALSAGQMMRIPILPAAACAMLVAMPATAQDAAFVRDVAGRLNAERAQRGLEPLRYDRKLEQAAQAHAEWMARSRRMEHLEEAPRSLDEQRSCNHHPVNRLINAGYLRWDDVFTVEPRPDGAVVHPRPAAHDGVGEIIAKGTNAGHPATQPGTVVPGWMHSPGHRKTILTPAFRAFGIGTACIDGDTYWCVVFATPTLR